GVDGDSHARWRLEPDVEVERTDGAVSETEIELHANARHRGDDRSDGDGDVRSRLRDERRWIRPFSRPPVNTDGQQREVNWADRQVRRQRNLEFPAAAERDPGLARPAHRQLERDLGVLRTADRRQEPVPFADLEDGLRTDRGDLRGDVERIAARPHGDRRLRAADLEPARVCAAEQDLWRRGAHPVSDRCAQTYTIGG